MLYCNTCGTAVKTLCKSHLLNKSRKRIGDYLLTCLKCHKDYHRIRGDWKVWGKKSVKARKKRGTFNMAFVSKGWKFTRRPEGK